VNFDFLLRGFPSFKMVSFCFHLHWLTLRKSKNCKESECWYNFILYQGNETNTNIIKSLFSMIHNHRGSPYFFSERNEPFFQTGIHDFQDLLDHWTIFHSEWFLKINNHQSFSIVISEKKSPPIKICSENTYKLRFLLPQSQMTLLADSCHPV
jgi:hypothetical protein